MANDDTDFQDILEGTVDEAEEKIRDLDSPDYEAILEAEKEGKDRKTLKDFLESRIGSSEEETEEESEEETVEDEEEVVSEIEDETSGGVMGSFSRTSVLAGGLILGLVLGFVAANATTSSVADGSQAPPATVQEAVRTVAGAGSNATVTVTEPVERHSMYNMNVTSSLPTENGTQEQQLEVYVTLDGRYLFTVQRQFGQMLRPIDLQQAVQRAQAQNAPSPDTGDNTEPETEDEEPENSTANATQ